MPLYSYKCIECDDRFERLADIKERHEQMCYTCGGHAELQISKPRVHTFKPILLEHTSLNGDYVESKQQAKELCKKRGIYLPGILD